jgi:hypothetical protein
MAALKNEDAIYAKLDALYHTVDSLKSTSTPEELAAFGALFSENCITYLRSMREFETPSVGRQATIDELKEILAQYHVAERRTLSRSVSISADGSSTVFSESKNKLHVLGESLDPFYETAVVTFDNEGLIQGLKNYSCRSHIVEIIQRETGVGPYAEGIVRAMKGKNEEKAACCQ